MGSHVDCHNAKDDDTLWCAASHRMRVLEPLAREGVEVRVFIATYSCDARRDRLLEAAYAPWLARAFFRPMPKMPDKDNSGTNQLMPMTQGALIHAGLDLVVADANERQLTYDGVLLLRCDSAILRQVHDFLPKSELADGEAQKFLFPTHGGKSNNQQIDGKPRVTDNLFWVPWGALPCFELVMEEQFKCLPTEVMPGGSAGHACFKPLSDIFRSRLKNPDARIGFMIKGVYDANTKHQSNPLYATLPRSEKAVRPQMRGDLLEHYNQLNACGGGKNGGKNVSSTRPPTSSERRIEENSWGKVRVMDDDVPMEKRCSFVAQEAKSTKGRR
jgi:hypothetical protein